MNKIWGCYTVFNEETNIGRSMRSIKAYVDGFVVVDCCFTANITNESINSTDNTEAIARKVAGDIPLEYIKPKTKLSEQAARNCYLSVIPEGDYLLWIDGDEVLYGNVNKMRVFFEQIRVVSPSVVACMVYTESIMFNGMAVDMNVSDFENNPIIANSGYMTKLYRKTEGMHYYDKDGVTEHAIYDKQNSLIGNGISNRTDVFFIINHHLRQSFESYKNDCIWVTEQRKWYN